MEVGTCKTCGKQFLNSEGKFYCRICSKKWHIEQERRQKEMDDQRWQEENKRNRALFEKKISGYSLISMKNIRDILKDLFLFIALIVITLIVIFNNNNFSNMKIRYYSFKNILGRYMIVKITGKEEKNEYKSRN